MERPLYAPVSEARSTATRYRPAGDDETDPAALFEQVYVDPAAARQTSGPRCDAAPAGRARRPVARRARWSQGLAELVTYLSLRDDASRPSTTTRRTSSGLD